MDQVLLDQNINKIKMLYIFHKEYMSYVMVMDQMENKFQILFHKLFIVNILFIFLDSLNQCL